MSMAAERKAASAAAPGQAAAATGGEDEPLPELLITPAEEKLVNKLRRSLCRQLLERQQSGREHSCLFGQFALTRALRGNDGDSIATLHWMRVLLDKAPAWDLDKLVSEMHRRLDASPDGKPLDTMLPHAGEVSRYIRAIFTAPETTPDGDPVNYIPLVLFDKRAIYTKMKWHHFVRYMHGATVLRIIECERLTVVQKRAVKVVTVIDLAGCGFSELVCPKFDLAYSRDVASFQTEVAAEIFGPIYVLNTPKFVMDLYWVLFRVLPERFRKKMRLVQGNGLEDPDFVRLVGGEAQLRALLAFREEVQAGEAAEDAPTCEEVRIARRGCCEVSLDVREGQRVRWSFEVLPGAGDALLGVSDVLFGVRGLWTGESKEAPEAPEERYQRLFRLLREARPEVVLAQSRVAASAGKVSGSCLADRPGVVTLAWGNGHSLARSKAVRYEVKVEGGSRQEEATEEPRAPRGRPRAPGGPSSGKRADGVFSCCVGRPQPA